jgi:hypothetical protein
MYKLRKLGLLLVTLVWASPLLGQTDPQGAWDYVYLNYKGEGYPGTGQREICLQLRGHIDNTGNNRVQTWCVPVKITGSNIVSVDTSLSKVFAGSISEHSSILVVEYDGPPNLTYHHFSVAAVNFTNGITGDSILANICLTIADTGTICLDTLHFGLAQFIFGTELAQYYVPGWGGTLGQGYPEGLGVCNSVPFCDAKPGDANASGTLTVADILSLFYYINGKPNYPPCGSNSGLCWLSDELCRGDWNGDGLVRFVDIQYGVNYIFNRPGGPWTPKPTKLCCLPVP